MRPVLPALRSPFLVLRSLFLAVAVAGCAHQPLPLPTSDASADVDVEAERLLAAGDLPGARARVSQAVSAHPEDAGVAMLAIKMAVLGEDFQAARELLSRQKPADDKEKAVFATLDGILSGEIARARTHRGEAAVTRLAETPPWFQPFLDVHARLQDSAQKDAADAELQAASKNVPPHAGWLDGLAFASLHDSDWVIGPSLEVLMDGGYALLPFVFLQEVVFLEDDSWVGQVWRAADLTLVDGTEKRVFVPVRYVGSARLGAPAATGAVTQWMGVAGQIPRGAGQRELYVTEPDGTESRVRFAGVRRIFFE